MHVDRNAAAIVGNRDRLVSVDADRDDVAVTRQGFVDGVVDHLENHVVQTGAIVGVTDVHARSFSDGLKSL